MDLRRSSVRRLKALLPAGLIVVTGLGCHGSPQPSPLLQRELGIARAATVPSDADRVTESGLEVTSTQNRVTWRFRQAKEVLAVQADAERRLAGAGYLCRREGSVLNCGKSLPGDRLNVTMTASDAKAGANAWMVEFTARPD